MNIPNPKARRGDCVQVLNYRYKPPQWVVGECRGTAYKEGWSTEYYWLYDVYIARGKGYFIYVSDEKIKRQ